MTKYEWALFLMCMPFPFLAGYLVGILRERWRWRGVDKKVNDWFEHLHADDPVVRIKLEHPPLIAPECFQDKDLC